MDKKREIAIEETHDPALTVRELAAGNSYIVLVSDSRHDPQAGNVVHCVRSADSDVLHYIVMTPGGSMPVMHELRGLEGHRFRLFHGTITITVP